MSIQDELARQGVVVVPKASSALMRFIGAVLGIFGIDFMDSFWTTISSKRIYAPNGVDLDRLDLYEVIIRHELVHVAQARKWPVWFQVSYLLFPLPFGLAWCRWYWERAAFMVDIKAGRLTVEQAVNMLSRYGWPWPKGLMRRFFEKQLEASR